MYQEFTVPTLSPNGSTEEYTRVQINGRRMTFEGQIQPDPGTDPRSVTYDMAVRPAQKGRQALREHTLVARRPSVLYDTANGGKRVQLYSEVAITYRHTPGHPEADDAFRLALHTLGVFFLSDEVVSGATPIWDMNKVRDLVTHKM